MRKILEACPTCGSEMHISELTCGTCDTVVRSRYTPCPFCRLAPEDLAFMLLFVRSRGNVKDMERELGVSYWTIRGRLNELIAAMGLGGEDGETPPATAAAGSAAATTTANPTPAAGSAAAPAANPTASKAAAAAARPRASGDAIRAILDRLQRGEITAQQAAEEMGGMGN